MLYMVTFTINIPQMLAYHTWILWVMGIEQEYGKIMEYDRYVMGIS